MQIQVNTDRNVEGHERLARYIEDKVRAALSQFGDQITRVEVHLSDETGAKSGGADKRCLLEARPAGRQPLAVSHEAATVEDAFGGAATKLQHLLKSTLGRAQDHKGGESIRGQSPVD